MEPRAALALYHSGLSPEETVCGFDTWPAVVELIGIEPTTSGLQSPRSPS